MVWSRDDPHSFAQPELARVLDTHLELHVNFKRKILQGKAILTIKKEPSVTEIILDNYKLNILRVTNYITGSILKHHVTFHETLYGNPLIVQLPQTGEIDYKSKCKIQIEYETSPDSPALYWLTPNQTADCTYPFLLSNNKLTYARAVFPCQDSPSVKFTYSAKIKVPKHFKVVMSAFLKDVFENSSQYQLEYEFLQSTPIPSYGVVIAVGLLQKAKLSSRSSIFVEKKFFRKSIKTFAEIEKMLLIAESLCGPYFWGTYDICVLPPSVSHFEIECPCVAFVSPSLLGGDITLVSSIARNIANNWAGNLVTCINHSNLWLSKSLSIFIYRKITHKMLIDDETKNFFEMRINRQIKDKIEKFKVTGFRKNLVPNLAGILPCDAIQYVPYEGGCILWEQIQYKLGGPSVFEPFLKSYLDKFAFQSINTDDWLRYLYQYFPDKKEVINSFHMYNYFYHVELYNPVIVKTTLETVCFNLAEEWIRWNDSSNYISLRFLHVNKFSDIQKIMFLNYLHASHEVLTVTKLQLMSMLYDFQAQNCEIRFIWLRLCIKSRWKDMVASALHFAIQFCSPNYAYPIFEDLFNWTEMRPITIKNYLDNKDKMLHETQKKLNLILFEN